MKSKKKGEKQKDREKKEEKRENKKIFVPGLGSPASASRA